MDLCEDDLNPHDPGDPKYNICFECFRLIKEMQLQYPTYFDENCFPPMMFKHLEKSRHLSKWSFINKSVRRKMKGKFEGVWQIIASYLSHLWDPNHRFTYREITYACNFINQLMYNIQAKGDAFDIDALFSFLIYLNFNDVEFVHYITFDIIDEMDEMILDYEKTELLQRLQIQFDAANVRLDCILDPSNPPINVMLSKWIRKELELLTI